MTTVDAGKVVVKTGVDERGAKKGAQNLEKRFKALSRKLAKFSRQTATAAASIGAPLVLAAKQFAATGDKIGKFAKRTNLSTDAAQAFGFAMEQSGSSMEALEPAIRAMNRNMLDAERGLATATDNFTDLGLSMDQLRATDTAGRFRLILKALQGVSDEGRRSALATKLLGRGGSELLPLLGNLEGLEKQFDTLGTKMSTEQVEAAEKMTDAFNKVSHQFKAITVQVGAALAPALTDVADSIGPSIKGVIEFVKQNDDLIITAGKVAVSLTGIAVATKALSLAMATNPFVLMAGAIGEALVMLNQMNGELDQTLKNVSAITGQGSVVSIAARGTGLGQGLGRAGASNASGPGLFSRYVGGTKDFLKGMVDAVQKGTEQAEKDRKDEFEGFGRILSNNIRLGIQGASDKVKQFGGVVGAGLQFAQNFAAQQQVPELAGFTSGALGSAAEIGSVGGPATPLEKANDLAGEQIELLDQINDGIDALRNRL